MHIRRWASPGRVRSRCRAAASGWAAHRARSMARRRRTLVAPSEWRPPPLPLPSDGVAALSLSRPPFASERQRRSEARSRARAPLRACCEPFRRPAPVRALSKKEARPVTAAMAAAAPTSHPPPAPLPSPARAARGRPRVAAPLRHAPPRGQPPHGPVRPRRVRLPARRGRARAAAVDFVYKHTLYGEVIEEFMRRVAARVRALHGTSWTATGGEPLLRAHRPPPARLGRAGLAVPQARPPRRTGRAEEAAAPRRPRRRRASSGPRCGTTTGSLPTGERREGRPSSPREADRPAEAGSLLRSRTSSRFCPTMAASDRHTSRRRSYSLCSSRDRAASSRRVESMRSFAACRRGSRRIALRLRARGGRTGRTARTAPARRPPPPRRGRSGRRGGAVAAPAPRRRPVGV